MTHLLFLMSDTGGGHRAASRAIDAALQERYPGQFTSELVDVWKDYTSFPFNRQPEMYGPWVNRSPQTYAAQYWIMERVLFRQNWFNTWYNNYAFKRTLKMLTEHPADMVICVHSAFARGVGFGMHKAHIGKPYIVVISDYAEPGAMWYTPYANKCLVPTEPAYERGLAFGLKPEQLVLTGAPVHPKFSHIKLSKQQARQELGWDTDARIVMLVGGGDGMGPLVKTARAIDARKLHSQLVVIAGRNEAFKQTLEATPWHCPTRIYGFVNNMEVMMTAADLLITKAGPATITEAAILGLPLVLSGAIPYQESPNADYVLAHGAGVYAPGPEKVAAAVESVLSQGNTQLEAMSRGIKSIAQPDAIWKIADEIKAFA